MTTNCPPNGVSLEQPGDPPPRPDPPPAPPGSSTTYYGWAAVCEQVADAGGVHPQFLDGLFMNIIADHFADPARIWDDSLRGLIWHKDPAVSKLSIFPATMVKRDIALDRPGIIVKRGGFKSTRIAIGDRDGVDGAETTRMVEGTHTFVAVGNSGPNANALGWELFMFLEAIAPVLRSEFGMDIAPDGGGEIAVLKDLGDQLAFPVTVSYRFLSTVVTAPIDPAIKVMTAEATTQV